MITPSIPYMGNKRTIAEHLVKAIRLKFPKARYFYDLFGGGGAVSTQAIHQGFNVHYNEIQPRVANLFEFLLNTDAIPPSWWDWISREDFFKIIKSDYTNAYSGMVQQCWSFGNDQYSYLFGKDKEDLKEQLHYLVVNKSKEARDILQSKYNLMFEVPKLQKLYDRYLKEYKVIIRGFRLDLQQLEQLQRLQQLQQLQQLEHKQRIIICSNLSYEDVVIKTPKEETVIYCDIPYKNTKSYASGDFDREKFDKWFAENEYPCFMSEYESNFKEVFSIEKRVLLGLNQLKKIEKLFWNGKECK